jgi:hypothetical protein
MGFTQFTRAVTQQMNPWNLIFPECFFCAKAGISAGKGDLLITGQKRGTQNSEVQYMAAFV